MPLFRDRLPQLDGELMLCDGGVETDLIFNHGVEIPHFAAHTLLTTDEGRAALTRYFEGFLDLAERHDVGFVLDTQTWKAHPHWAADLASTESELRDANREAVEFIASLRSTRRGHTKPIVLNGLIGPRGDAYAPGAIIGAAEAERYHRRQLEWLADTEVDMASAMTFTSAHEAAGVVRAAVDVGLPVVVSFTVELDGRLPDGGTLANAITEVDDLTDGGRLLHGQLRPSRPLRPRARRPAVDPPHPWSALQRLSPQPRRARCERDARRR